MPPFPGRCDSPFEVWGTGCYKVTSNPGHLRGNWTEHEARCQAHGSNVHLAGMENDQVFVRKSKEASRKRDGN